MLRVREAQYNLQQRIKEASETEQEDRKGRIASLRAEMLKVEENAAKV